jgi:hypothetical protein
MNGVKAGSWLEDLIEVYNDLGGSSGYRDVYELAKERRKSRGASWTPQAQASIRRTVEDHAESSDNFRGRAVFYSVNGHGKGVWGLMPEYLREMPPRELSQEPAYQEGIEGILREVEYLRKSRDPRLVEARKELDDYTCQVCSFKLMTEKNRYVIDVHHLNPIGHMAVVSITSVDDLVCLCPTCHRIAHSRRDIPLDLNEVRLLLGKRLT